MLNHGELLLLAASESQRVLCGERSCVQLQGRGSLWRNILARDQFRQLS